MFHIQSRQEYDTLYRQSLDNPDEFWSKQAENFYWKTKWSLPVTKSNFDTRSGRIFAEWFPGAQTNLCYNALDRHIEQCKGDKVAFYWEGNSPDQSYAVTYK